MKRITYIAPIDYIRGSLSGRQDLKYNGGSAFSIATGQIVPADNYAPRMIAKIYHAYTERAFRTFSVRTRTSVNMTTANKLSLAVMGGAGAIYASLINHKNAPIYAAIYAAFNAEDIKGLTLRQFVMPKVMEGLRDHSAQLSIADGVYIVNPWIGSETPNVPVSAAILDKFRVELS